MLPGKVEIKGEYSGFGLKLTQRQSRSHEILINRFHASLISRKCEENTLGEKLPRAAVESRCYGGGIERTIKRIRKQKLSE